MKKNWKSILLIAFAIVAVYIACLPSSVAIYDLTQIREPLYCSYFNLVENVVGNICLPVAALCACANLMTAGIYLALKNKFMIPVIKLLSMASALLAVVPVLVKDPAIQLVPNVLLPIAMLAEYAVAACIPQKQTTSVESPLKGKRLK